MTWAAIAPTLVLWLTGVLLRWGQWVNLLLLVAVLLLAVQVIVERRLPARRA